MASFRFIHCADLHIDSPLRGLEADPDAPVERIRGATRHAFTALVDFAIQPTVDFVLAAGDLYDGDWTDWRSGQFLVHQVARLSQADIPFVCISGNHDAQSVITRKLGLRGRAHQFLPERAATLPLSHLNVAVHGQSFKNAAVKDDLSKDYPPGEAGKFNIGLLHTNVDGREGHENYAPSNLATLRAFRYDYWALGHVHTRQVLSTDPWIVYPGNLQGRHARETGPKGAYLVTVENGQIAGEPEFVPFDTVRWEIIDVAVDGVADEDAALAVASTRIAAAIRNAQGRLLAARLRFIGATPAYAALQHRPVDLREKLRAETAAFGGLETIWIEDVKVAVTPQNEPAATSEPLAREIQRLDHADLAQEATLYVKDLLNRLPGLRDELRALDPKHPLIDTDDGDLPQELLDRARDLLLARLAGG
jgi:exonuclease SbcD